MVKNGKNRTFADWSKHLRYLEDAGLVATRLALSQEGKALNYFEGCSFPFELEQGAMAEAARSLTAKIES